MGLTWAAGWLGAGVALWVGLLAGGLPVELLEFVVLFSTTGLVGGTIFAGALSLAEGKRRLRDLSMPRFAGLGALAGFGVSVVLATAVGGTLAGQLVYIGVLTTLGAGSAAGSLTLARKAEHAELLAAESPGLIRGQ
jgi:hypothetical protein